MARFDLTDFEWRVIEPLLPNKPRGVPRVDDMRVMNGIFWRLRTGAPCADIPERYGPRLLSTAIIREINGHDVSSLPVAWFHECREMNNDSTNYRSFSPQGLRLALKRAGWILKDEFIVEPEGPPDVPRMFCYCERVSAWTHLRLHHDF